MRNWVLVGLLFSSKLIAAPLTDVTVLQPIESQKNSFDPYVWSLPASCSTDGKVLKVQVGRLFTDNHFSGALELELNLASLPQWSNQNMSVAFGGGDHWKWKAPKGQGSLKFTNRKGLIYATDNQLGGCEVKAEKNPEKKQTTISLYCQGLPVSSFVPGVRFSAGGRINFEVPAEHPIVCNDILP